MDWIPWPPEGREGLALRLHWDGLERVPPERRRAEVWLPGPLKHVCGGKSHLRCGNGIRALAGLRAGGASQEVRDVSNGDCINTQGNFSYRVCMVNTFHYLLMPELDYSDLPYNVSVCQSKSMKASVSMGWLSTRLMERSMHTR